MRTLTTLFLLSCAGLKAAIVDGHATITTLKGSGKVDATNASQGSLVKPEQRIQTDKDSQAIVWLSNGLRMVVNANAVVLFKVMKQEEGSLQAPNPEDKSLKETGPSITEIQVESGKVIGDVKKLVPMSVYTLKTPVGTVSIKGTVFSVEYKKNDDGTVAFNIGCLVGRVVVQMADPKIQPVSIPAGKVLSVSAAPGDTGTGPGPAPKLSLAPMPPAEMKAINANSSRPPPPPPRDNAPPPRAPAALDAILRNMEVIQLNETLNPSPTGG